MENETERAQRVLRTKLKQIRGKAQVPAQLIDLLQGIAEEQILAQPKAEVAVPQGCPETRELLLGKPMVERERFPYDPVQATQLFTRFLALAGEAPGPLAEAVSHVRTAIDAAELDPADVFERVLQDDADFFHAWAQRTPEAPQALYFLAFAAMGPGLAAAGAQLARQLPEVASWNTGTCPVCGSLPLISSLREKEGFRWDVCSFCRHEYRVRRMACSVCGETDQHKLTFFTVDEEPGYRVDVCETCKSYIKTIDFRALDRVALPQLDDLDSLALDFVAREQGFSRPTLSAWGF